MADETNTAPGDAGGDHVHGSGCNSQVTDGVTQSSVHVLGLGPATAAVNSYLGQAASQNALFLNMVNQQQQYAQIAAATLTRELTQMFELGDNL